MMSGCASQGRGCGRGIFPGAYGLLGGGIIFAALYGWGLGMPGVGMSRAEVVVGICSLVGLGVATAYGVMGAVAVVMGEAGLRKDPLPMDVDVRDRGVAGEQALALAGRGGLAGRLRPLLRAWGGGASGVQVTGMAREQFGRGGSVLGVEMGGTGLMLVGGMLWPVCGGLMGGGFGGGAGVVGAVLCVVVPMIWIARRQVLAREGAYVECHLLARIGGDTAAGEAGEYAGMISRATAEGAGVVAKAAREAAERLAGAVGEAAAGLGAGVGGLGGELAAAQREGVRALIEAEERVVKRLGLMEEGAAKELERVHMLAAKEVERVHMLAVKELEGGQRQVAEQLGRLAGLGEAIERLLQVEKSVDGAWKAVATADEFREVLIALKRHLGESDLLLKRAAKPRRIQLVEGEAG